MNNSENITPAKRVQDLRLFEEALVLAVRQGLLERDLPDWCLDGQDIAWLGT